MRESSTLKALRAVALAGLVGSGGLALAACEREGYTPPPDEYAGTAADMERIDYGKRKTIFGTGGLNLFGSSDNASTGGGGIGVNSFLWRASLDTIAFMPVNSADAFGGVIITDWHSSADAPSERFKLNIYILGRTLRADGIRVAVFRQVQDRAGNWRDAAVPEETGIKIEDAILIRARQLRNDTLQQ